MIQSTIHYLDTDKFLNFASYQGANLEQILTKFQQEYPGLRIVNIKFITM